MANNISLTASMRSNLLSLQNISRQVSSTQNKLATGNKVNSAIDNPSSYYTARSLNNRANDLDALLDSMGQAVSTIKAATTALETGATFLEQAAAVATSALETAKIPGKEWFEAQDNVSAVVSNWSELKAALDSGKAGNIVIYGNITAEDQIVLKEGQNLVGVGYYGVSEPDTDKFSQINIDIEKLGSTYGIRMQADNLLVSDLSIKAVMGKTISVAIGNFGSNSLLQNIDLAMDNYDQLDYLTNTSALSYGISGERKVTMQGVNNIYETRFTPQKTICSVGVTNVNLDGVLNINMQQQAGRGVLQDIDVYNNSQLNIVAARYRGLDNANCNLYGNSSLKIEAPTAMCYGKLTLNDNATADLTASRLTFVSNSSGAAKYPVTISINSIQARLNIKSPYIFNNADKLINFKAVAGSQISANDKVYKADNEVNDNLMDGNNMPAGFVEVAGAGADPIPSLDWLREQNANRNMRYDYKNDTEESGKQYAGILQQYDSVIKDSTYKGVNLLRDEKLNVRFNENGSADLNVAGKDMSSNALGLSTVEWSNQGDIAQSLQEIACALKSIRAFTAELGNNYSIITNRQEFTENLINILTEGADKLTLADMNEESANMLSLQTRQQLAINSLSLASQASQAVLKLF